MPPTSRRQKIYDDKQRTAQGRNLIAGLFFLLVGVGSFFLIRQLMPSQTPTIHVSINRVNHAGTREIPFSADSCKRIKDAFDASLKCQTDTSIQLLTEQEMNLKLLDREIAADDVLIVYLNGHLTDANSRPSTLTVPTSPVETTDDDVYWVGPESAPGEERLSELMSDVMASKAKIKLILLDAGRYTWTPTFPGRQINKFQSRLAEKLKSSDWNQAGELWIITSHSDAEISNVSTPLQGSLFSIAVEESLKSLAVNGPQELKVPALFEEIRKRTTSYSRNFHDRSLQNPVLMKAGIGMVSGAIETAAPLVIKWNRPGLEETPTEEKPPEYEWRQFADSPEVFLQWLLESENYGALPKQTIERAELFLEQGKSQKGWSGSDQNAVDEYSARIRENDKEPLNTDFDRDTLSKKQTQIVDFRRALLEYSLITRFRNQMRFWDDNAFENVVPITSVATELGSPVNLDDFQITEPKTIPAIQRWPVILQMFMADTHTERLVETINRERKQEEPFSPLQAELIGVMTKRYLPIIDRFESFRKPTETDDPNKKNIPPDDRLEKFKISLTPQPTTDRYDPDNKSSSSDPGAGFRAVIAAAQLEIQPLRVAVDPITDTANRFLLVAGGSEISQPRTGIVPNIAWTATKRSIEITSRSTQDAIRVPFYERKDDVVFDLRTAVVKSVDLKITPIGDKLEGLKFGFDKDFVDTKVLNELDGSGQHFSKTFNVYFHYPQPDKTMIGNRFAFEISATDRDAQNESSFEPFAFTIVITQDAQFKIVSKRALANRNDDRSQARLYRWGTPPTDDEWEPWVLNTLANVKAPFEFSLAYEFESSKTFTAKMYQIGTLRLESDNNDLEDIQNLVRELGTQSNTAGTPPLERESFKLIAQTEIELSKGGKTATLNFLPPPIDPEAKDAQPAPETYEIKHGILIALFPKDDSGAETSRIPQWYQFLFFQPEEPVNPKDYGLKLKPAIVDKFGSDDVFKLADNLAPGVDIKLAVKLTVVSEEAFQQNKNIVKPLDLESVLAGDGAAPQQGNSHALLMFEALGIPNFKTYQSDGSSLIRTGFRSSLTGVRVAPSPTATWDCYPNTWSFAAENPPTRPFEWLAGKSSDVQDIFVRVKETEKGRGTGELELFLPFKGNLLGPGEFWFRWEERLQRLKYPNERKHFIGLNASGFKSWTEVKSHTIPISDVSGQTLTIGRKGEETQPLGQWRFITRSPEVGPSLTIKPTRVEVSDLNSAIINFKTSQIKPTINAELIKLTLDDELMPKEKLKSFLRSTTIADGEYRFSFAQLQQQFPPDKKLKPNTVVSVQVTDFFEQPYSASSNLEIFRKKVVKPEPKPEPTTITVSFAHGDTPVQLREFISVKLNGNPIAIGQRVPFNNSTITISSSKEPPSLKIDGIFPGEYSLTVEGQIKRTGSNQYTTATASQNSISVPKEGAETTLTFK